MTTFSKLFTDHPEAVGENYFEHMAFAFKFSGRLFRAAFAALEDAAVATIFGALLSWSALAPSALAPAPGESGAGPPSWATSGKT